MKTRYLAALALLAVSPIALADDPIVAPGQKVLKYTGPLVVADGDTVYVRGHPFRLKGYNTPESFNPFCYEEYIMAKRAKDRLQALINTTRTTLVPESCRDNTQNDERDPYGRSCARLYVDDAPVATILINENLAEPYTCQGGKCPPRRNWCPAGPGGGPLRPGG